MTSKQLKVYHGQWSVYQRNVWPDTAPDYMGVIHSFWDIGSDNKILTKDNYADREKGRDGWGTPSTQWDMYKARVARGIETHLAIGGWTYSGNFSNACLTDTSRNAFTDSIIQTFKANPGVFNGVSLDWEYPSDKGVLNGGLSGNISRVGDGGRFIQTINLLRSKLNLNGFARFPITAFCSGDPNKLEGHINVKALSEALDEIHIQSYDFSDGNWGDTITAHNCNLYPKPGVTNFSGHEAVQYYLSKGADSLKLHLGVASYTRGFSGTTGIGKPATGGANENWSWEKGVLDYKMVLNGGTGINDRIVTPFGLPAIWDEEMQADYFFDPVKKVLISCDTPRSIQAKANYTKQYNLGGLYMWDLAGDLADKNNSQSLCKAMRDHWVNRTSTGLPIGAPLPIGGPVNPVPVTPVPIVTLPGFVSDKMFAPFMDWTLYPSPPLTLLDVYNKTGQKKFVMAFLNLNAWDPLSGVASWAGASDPSYHCVRGKTPYKYAELQALRAVGGDIIISFGGLIGAQEPAYYITDLNKLADIYQTVIDVYQAKHLDWDIEGGEVFNSAGNLRRAKALKIIQNNNPGIKLTMTLPVNPDGLTANGGMVILQQLKNEGVNLHYVNGMAMEFHWYHKTGNNLSVAIIQSGQKLIQQLNELGLSNTNIGLTPMIGQSFAADEVAYLEDFERVIEYMRTEPRAYHLSFWSVHRDNGKEVNKSATYDRSGIIQEDFAFTKLCNRLLGGGTPAPAPVTPPPPPPPEPSPPPPVTPPVVVVPVTPVPVTPVPPVVVTPPVVVVPPVTPVPVQPVPVTPVPPVPVTPPVVVVPPVTPVPPVPVTPVPPVPVTPVAPVVYTTGSEEYWKYLLFLVTGAAIVTISKNYNFK